MLLSLQVDQVFSGFSFFFPPLRGVREKIPHVNFEVSFVELKTNAQRQSCELCFIWGKMRTAAQGISLQIALRNYSKEVEVGKVNIYVILVKGAFMESSAYFTKGFLLVMRT